MEQSTGKESVVARLFKFGRRKEEPVEETGFARTDEGSGDAEVRVPEQVIRVRPEVRRKDEVITAIGDSFRELTKMLGSVSDRLDRQDNRSADLSEQLKELPDYLRALPRLQQEQNDALRNVGERLVETNEIARTAAAEQSEMVRDFSARFVEGAGRVASALERVPEAQEEQARALGSLSERVAEGTDAVHAVSDALARIPEEIRERSHVQEEAIRQVASAQQQTAKVIYAGHQKSLQLFHQATQKTLQNVERQARVQKRQMEEMLVASVTNMKRMFWLAAAFMVAAATALGGLFLFR